MCFSVTDNEIGTKGPPLSSSVSKRIHVAGNLIDLGKLFVQCATLLFSGKECRFLLLKNMKPKWSDYPRTVKLVFVIYTLCFLWATKNHIIDIWRGGLLPYNYAPLAFNCYWTSLTLLDPLAIVLLYYRPYQGMVLAVLIMISDIAVNLYATYTFWNGDIYTNRLLQLQILFGIFVFSTVPIVWKRLAGPTSRKA